MISRSRLLSGASRRLGNRAARRTVPRLGAQRVVAPVASVLSGSQLLGGSTRFYSTERVLALRTGEKDAHRRLRTVYDPTNEKENCGVGLIASLKSVPSRDIVEKADEMLVRMSHRGGCGCDPASGDGSGELLIRK